LRVSKTTSMLSTADINTALATIIDPELGFNIVDLGLIYHIDITSMLITITMTLTSPGCPLAPFFIDQVKEVVGHAANLSPDQIIVNITFDPPWSMDALSPDMKLKLGF
jgi:metal-sulfur cluster biosynthetic enzyme